jgi:hypothetical protein
MSKPRLVRFYLLCLAALALACAYPEWAVCLPPLLFFPGQAGCFCCAPAAACSKCSGTTPSEYLVEIAGVVEGTCGVCASLNASYVLAFTSDSGGVCNWDLVVSPTICNIDSVFVDHSAFPFTGTTVSVSDSGANGWGYAKSRVFAFDCNTSAEDIPFSGVQGSPTCDATSSTCALTGL